jgi:LPPG:FO 2-phospho-L-lactate transferase
MDDTFRSLRVVAFAGGTGGARLSAGLDCVLSPGALSVIVNTGDDFDHLGLRICPDLDTIMYTLADLINHDAGWGIRDDTRNALDMLKRYGADDWFILSDRDLATHLLRTQRLRSGASLSEVTAGLAQALGLRTRLFPMCNSPVATKIITTAGERLDFQEYFVHRRHADPVARIDIEGMAEARLPDEAAEALERADVIVFCPSNPFVSIGPILGVEGVRHRLEASRAHRIAVSPIVGGAAVKGPAAAMLASQGHEVSAIGVARLYRGLIDSMLIDTQDATLAPAIEALGIRAVVAPSMMYGAPEREALARAVLTFALTPLPAR